ncbi:MAG: hypothetical protein K0R57_1912 [Paenibacillaceae bacterium]|nr:hypothetical protein [Paenibacillaceae bacterium]
MEALKRQLPKGQAILNWLYAGPFDKDVSHIYDDNYKVPVAPYLTLLEEATELAGTLLPREGKEERLFGQTCRWSLLQADASEHKVTWARFGIHARLMVTYAYTRLAVQAQGKYRFRFWLTGSARIMVNGQPVFSHLSLGRVEENFRLELELSAGENEIVVMLANVHLHCANSFFLVPEDETGCCELPLLLGGTERQLLEEDLQRFYMITQVVSSQDQVMLHWDEAIASKGVFVLEVWSGMRGQADRLVYETSARLDGEARSLVLPAADSLPSAGEYMLNIDYEVCPGKRISGISLAFKRIDWLTELPRGADYQARKKYMLETMAAQESNVRAVIYTELAKMETGDWASVDYDSIDRTLEYINARYDCADFAMHGLLRMYARYADSGRLEEGLLQRLKSCILNFKYWVDEAGPSMMFTRSENHEILFYSAEYIAGLLFPKDIFPNSGQNGLFHALKGRLLSERWIKEKGTYGFMEWHSNTYYEEDILAMLTIYDFGEENSMIRIMARQLLDLICGIMACHTTAGVMATTHGRSYEETVIHPELEAISCLNWLLFGQSKRLVRKHSIGSIALAASAYSPDPEWEAVACDESDLFTRSCMGLFPHRGMDGVQCATYRTRDYMVSGMVESKAGEHGGQVHAGQVLLDGSVPVFATCFDNKSAMTRPSYWGGQYIIPRMFAHYRVLAYAYKLKEGPGFTHVYFPFAQFDEVLQQENWLFGRKNDAYIAVYSQHPYTVTRHGSYKNRELLCLHKDNIWLMEAGSREQWGSFEQFAGAVSRAELGQLPDGGLFYESPSSGRISLHNDRPFAVDGKPLSESGVYPLIDNKHAYGEYGSGVVRFRFPTREKLLNFRF